MLAKWKARRWCQNHLLSRRSILLSGSTFLELACRRNECVITVADVEIM